MTPNEAAKKIFTALSYGSTPVTRYRGNPISSFRPTRDRITRIVFFTYTYEQEAFGREMNQHAFLQLNYDDSKDTYTFRGLAVTQEEYITWFPSWLQFAKPGDDFDMVTFIAFMDGRDRVF